METLLGSRLGCTEGISLGGLGKVVKLIVEEMGRDGEIDGCSEGANVEEHFPHVSGQFNFTSG